MVSAEPTERERGAASASQGEARIHSAREHKLIGAPAKLLLCGEKQKCKAFFVQIFAITSNPSEDSAFCTASEGCAVIAEICQKT